jgi:putative ABC transport system permease protein
LNSFALLDTILENYMRRLLKRLNKSKSLRGVNLAGLSVIFAGLLLSIVYIKKEWSYDRFHANADRLVRYSYQTENQPSEARIWGISPNDPEISGIPGIEESVFLVKAETGLLEYQGEKQVLSDFYQASRNFFEVFSFPLLAGDKARVLEGAGKAVVSERFARRLFGNESPIGKELTVSGRRINTSRVFVSGVFKDFPETSHFHTDFILSHPEETYYITYIYLLLHPSARPEEVGQLIAKQLEKENRETGLNRMPRLTPLTDIHLRSHLARELEPNGDILYIYLVAGANLLLLVVVLFNLRLNAGLIFAYNRRYYQLLRLNGASSLEVVKDESLLALLLGIASILLGGLACYALGPYLGVSLSVLVGRELVALCGLFLFLVWLASIQPVFAGLPATLFLNTKTDTKPARFSSSSLGIMLMAQYSMVMFIVIMSFGISKQIRRIQSLQVGGLEENVLVMKEQPEEVQERYEVLKAELLKYPEIESVTSAMQLPGVAIRDAIGVWREGETSDNKRSLSILVVGEDFFPFFRIQPLAGATFKHSSRTYSDEKALVIDFYTNRQITPAPLSEEYIINRKAMQALGFASPEEAIGQPLFLDEHGGVGYINKGIIAGVTDDFNYTTLFEESQPQIILQRKNFLHCILLRLSPGQKQQGLATFTRVWASVNPGYPADYTFLQDMYATVYQNELNAQALVRIFALLSLLIANLGLISILAFIIKRKTKEIGIRKVNGATTMDIIRLLNLRFFLWIGVAFILAVPVAYWVMSRWLQHFAYKTDLNGWVFALAGMSVGMLSVLAVSIPSWRASRLNPVQALKID